MNDEQRDPQEEMDNAMIPFRENGVKVFNRLDPDYIKGSYIRNHPERCTVEQHPNGDIYISTDLIQAPDGSLWRFTPDA
jgi:hypothetical protein